MPEVIKGVRKVPEELPNIIETDTEAVHLLEVVQDHCDRKAFEAAGNKNEELYRQYKSAGRNCQAAQNILGSL